MNKSNMNIMGFAIVIMLMMIASCKHHPDFLPLIGGNGGGVINPPDTIVIINPDPCDPDTVYFTNTILPLLNSNCAISDCHDAISHEDGVRLYDYSHIMQQVTAGSLNNSDLYEAITETNNDIMPPSPYNELTSEQIGLIATWIQQGAKNNACTEDCDPAGFSFAQNIEPIIDLTCSGCHSGSNPSGNLTLDTYEQIKTIALDGRLMHSLNATNGFTIMPDNTTGLPECNITQFQNWVDAGAPNN